MSYQHEDIRAKRAELIKRFGEERFLKSSLTNMVVETLARGGDPLDIISQLIQAVEGVQMEFEGVQMEYREHLKRCKGIPVIISADKADEILNKK